MRFSTQLVCAPHFFHGQYHGFDIHKKSIDWAKAHITRRHSNFSFQLVDLKNSYYNPHGKLDPETFVFPYDDNKFDFAFAVSVFTHMVPRTTRNYLEQISRVLKPEGRALLTFLILDKPQKTLRKLTCEILKEFLISLGSTGKWHHHDEYSIISPEKPEAMVAYQEKALPTMLEQYNLQTVKTYYGVWNGREEYLSFQDIMIVRKS